MSLNQAKNAKKGKQGAAGVKKLMNIFKIPRHIAKDRFEWEGNDWIDNEDDYQLHNTMVVGPEAKVVKALDERVEIFKRYMGETKSDAGDRKQKVSLALIETDWGKMMQLFFEPATFFEQMMGITTRTRLGGAFYEPPSLGLGLESNFVVYALRQTDRDEWIDRLKKVISAGKDEKTGKKKLERYDLDHTAIYKTVFSMSKEPETGKGRGYLQRIFVLGKKKFQRMLDKIKDANKFKQNVWKKSTKLAVLFRKLLIKEEYRSSVQLLSYLMKYESVMGAAARNYIRAEEAHGNGYVFREASKFYKILKRLASVHAAFLDTVTYPITISLTELEEPATEIKVTEQKIDFDTNQENDIVGIDRVHLPKNLEIMLERKYMGKKLGPDQLRLKRFYARQREELDRAAFERESKTFLGLHDVVKHDKKTGKGKLVIEPEPDLAKSMQREVKANKKSKKADKEEKYKDKNLIEIRNQVDKFFSIDEEEEEPYEEPDNGDLSLDENIPRHPKRKLPEPEEKKTGKKKQKADEKKESKQEDKKEEEEKQEKKQERKKYENSETVDYGFEDEIEKDSFDKRAQNNHIEPLKLNHCYDFNRSDNCEDIYDPDFVKGGLDPRTEAEQLVDARGALNQISKIIAVNPITTIHSILNMVGRTAATADIARTMVSMADVNQNVRLMGNLNNRLREDLEPLVMTYERVRNN